MSGGQKGKRSFSWDEFLSYLKLARIDNFLFFPSVSSAALTKLHSQLRHPPFLFLFLKQRRCNPYYQFPFPQISKEREWSENKSQKAYGHGPSGWAIDCAFLSYYHRFLNLCVFWVIVSCPTGSSFPIYTGQLLRLRFVWQGLSVLGCQYGWSA